MFDISGKLFTTPPQRVFSTVGLGLFFRTTPALFGLFSWVTLAAHLLLENQQFPVRAAAWYAKSLPTFADAIALVRQNLWPASETFCMSPAKPDVLKVSRPMFDRIIESLCYAA